MPHFIYDPDLPTPLINALKESVFEYSKARKKFLSRFEGQYDVEFSVTDLTTPPKLLWLKRRHRKEIVINLVEDNYLALLGTSIHSILEKYAPKECIVEDRQHSIFNIEGVRVLFHGQPDVYDPHICLLDDYKHTSPKAVMYDKWEYEFQLNANKYLFEGRGMKVSRIRNIYLLRDLDRREQERNPHYPTSYIIKKEFEPWNRSVTEAKIKELIAQRINARELKRKELPDCTEEERWMRGAKYTIEKRVKAKSGEVGEWRKTAFKVFDTEEECKTFLRFNPQDEETKIEYRPGTALRCEKYCPVVQWCHQRQSELKLLETNFKQKTLLLDD